MNDGTLSERERARIAHELEREHQPRMQRLKSGIDGRSSRDDERRFTAQARRREAEESATVEAARLAEVEQGFEHLLRALGHLRGLLRDHRALREVDHHARRMWTAIEKVHRDA